MGLIFVDRVEIYDLGTIVKPTSAFKPVVGERDVVEILGRTKGSDGLNDVNLERNLYLSYCLDFLEKGQKESRGPGRDREIMYIKGDSKVLEMVSFRDPVRFSHLDELSQHPHFTRIDSPYTDVCLETLANGTQRRYMIDTDDQGFDRRRKLNLGNWDADVMERIKLLPEHVRKVLLPQLV